MISLQVKMPNPSAVQFQVAICQANQMAVQYIAAIQLDAVPSRGLHGCPRYCILHSIDGTHWKLERLCKVWRTPPEHFRILRGKQFARDKAAVGKVQDSACRFVGSNPAKADEK